jgi:YHS domain-containing protein
MTTLFRRFSRPLGCLKAAPTPSAVTRRLGIGLALALTAIVPAAGALPAVNVSRGQLALRGYDAVAYHVDGKAVPGQGAYEHRWNGAVWRFSSTANREAFVRAPARYAPEFGGYCAYAVSRGYTADGDPNAWRIVDGRLYLNYSKRVQRLWEEDIPGNIAKGRRNWPGVLEK